MGIVRRVEYIRYCDVADCVSTTGSEAADWLTRKAAEDAARRDGWVEFRRGKWMCPKCKHELWVKSQLDQLHKEQRA